MKKKSLFLCCVLIILTTLGACSSKPENDPNVQSVKTVLNEALTAPNEQLVNAILDPIEKIESGELSTALLNYQNRKNEILAKVNAHNTKPSFNNQTITLNVGDTITLNNTNGVLSKYGNLASNSANLQLNTS